MSNGIKYKNFNNKSVSNIAYGCATLANIYNPISEYKSNDIISFCYKNGINYFDVAPFYGGGVAEQRLGIGITNIPRDKIFIATKIGRYTDKESLSGAGGYFDFSPSKIEESIKLSMKNIGINHIDLLQCHDIEYVNTKDILDILPLLEHYRNIGIINSFGINTYPLDVLCDIINTTNIKIDSVGTYAQHTIINNTLNDYIPYFESKDIKVINSSPLGMGLLTDKGPPSWHPASKLMLNTVTDIKMLCNNNNNKIEEVSMIYSLNNSNILTTISGGNSIEEIRNNINFLDSKINDSFFKQINAISSPIKNKLWGPENGVTPIQKWNYI